VIGTLRLVPKNPFENIPRGTIIGPSPQTVVTAQKQMLNRLIEQLASEKESNRVLSARLHKRGMCSLPILQSNDLEQKATDLLNAYPLIAEVSRVVVHPGYRGLGVSTLLLRAATAVALELNLDLLLLECIPSHMQMYHDKYGFELIEGGAHGRAQQLDQFAVAMKLDLKNTGSSEYLDLPKRGLAAIHAHGNDPAGLFKSKYFCLCRESDCWQKGAYGAWLKQACPLYSLHTSKSVKQVAKQS
jgi:GNAT superfamily N-acetyltransferase